MTIAKQLNIKEFPFDIKDSNGNEIYFEDQVLESSLLPHRYWYIKERDSKGNTIYYENSKGVKIDNRHQTTELTLDEIANKFNIPVENLRIKK